MDLSKIESGFYFDPSAAGSGFGLIKGEDDNGPLVQVAWYGFDALGNERFLVGSLRYSLADHEHPKGSCVGDLWRSIGRGLRPTHNGAERVGMMSLFVDDGQLAAKLVLPHSYVHPVDVSPPPPPGALVTASYWLVRL